MRTLFEILGLILLTTPVIWEIHNDRKGDDHLIPLGFGWTMKAKTLDVYYRAVIAVLVSLVNMWIAGASFWLSLLLCGAFHFLVFDYAIAYVLGRKNWFEYLGEKSAIDNIHFWRKSDPVSRLFIRIGIFSLALKFYFHL